MATKNRAKSLDLAVNRVFKKLKIVFIAKQIFAPKNKKIKEGKNYVFQEF